MKVGKNVGAADHAPQKLFVHDYIADMVAELAELARASGESSLGRLLYFVAVEAELSAQRHRKQLNKEKVPVSKVA